MGMIMISLRGLELERNCLEKYLSVWHSFRSQNSSRFIDAGLRLAAGVSAVALGVAMGLGDGERVVKIPDDGIDLRLLP